MVTRADHHEAMKKSGGSTFFENLSEMRISQGSSKECGPDLLHGFMVIRPWLPQGSALS